MRCPQCKADHRLRVSARLGNASAFSGYRWTPSAYSKIHCLNCSHSWRTKADVSAVPDMPADWNGHALCSQCDEPAGLSIDKVHYCAAHDPRTPQEREEFTARFRGFGRRP